MTNFVFWLTINGLLACVTYFEPLCVDSYLRQKHLFSNYLDIISNYVHMIVINCAPFVLLPAAFFRQMYLTTLTLQQRRTF